MEEKIRKKIIKELAIRDLTMDDLTQEELEQLEEEIKEVEENGPCFLDGVLFSIPPYSRSRISKRMKK